ncbi:tRNA modification GTPase [Lacipirellula limnantheis]|uniref:tRNA modification GTPase MnmE n=1 Tax=Lacipirellula limnantheis TaxID=2528024 RepID=A0A517TX44_9BACT|nr:GTPase [Lacipirellula limnantheis]QDT72940.1 tRNA modification GTPase MnmE [Lacipirellula limnantheis]
MSYDLDDTIAAVASAAGGGARGVVRVSGPQTATLLAQCFHPSELVARELQHITKPSRIHGAMQVSATGDGSTLRVPGFLLLWPGTHSYTRQPSAEFHTLGSAPLLAAVVETLGCHGIRVASPGEFTLRAFAAGRIDLTQAEGVLGVIDAQGREHLDAALDQVAGGLSRPLHQLREDLLSLLAELEAGLDFVEEDIEFISRESLKSRLAAARAVVAATQRQLGQRDQRNEAPRIVLSGAPNAGKSSLFNALLQRFGDGIGTDSIVSPKPGATRDYVVGRISLDGLDCELVDTAGVEEGEQLGVAKAAQETSGIQRRTADVRLICIETTEWRSHAEIDAEIVVLTKSDLRGETFAATPEITAGAIPCSSLTGAGLNLLAARIRDEIGRREGALAQFGAVAATSARCQGSLRRASESLSAAAVLVDGGSDELLAAEIRHCLDAVGEIVGAICADDVLDRVFGQFCIGK